MSDDGLMSYFARIGLDTSEFLGGLQKADSGVLQFYRDVSVSMMATMVVFDKVMQYGQQFINLANQASEFISTLDKLSVTTGMSNEELQRFSNVARYADGDIGSLAMSINRMQMMLSDTGASGDEARKYLDAMNVSYKNTDGSLKSSAELFPNIIEGIRNLGSSAERVTAANAIFGRSYQSLSGYMDMSKEDMIKYFDTAKVLTEEQTQSLRDYETAIKDLNTSTTNLSNTAGAELAPSLTEVSQLLNDLAGNEGVIGFFEWLNGAITLVSRGLHIMGAEATAAYQYLAGDVSGAKETQRDLNDWIQKKFRDDVMKNAGYRTDSFGNVVLDEGTTATGTKLPASTATTSATGTTSSTDFITKSIEKIKAGTLSVDDLKYAWDKGNISVQQYNEILAGVNDKTKDIASSTDDLTSAVEAYNDALNEKEYSTQDYLENVQNAGMDMSKIRQLSLANKQDVREQDRNIAKAQSAISAAATNVQYGDVIVQVNDREIKRVPGVAAGGVSKESRIQKGVPTST
jgi:uncharacterized protein YoxC